MSSQNQRYTGEGVNNGISSYSIILIIDSALLFIKLPSILQFLIILVVLLEQVSCTSSERVFVSGRYEIQYRNCGMMQIFGFRISIVSLNY